MLDDLKLYDQIDQSGMRYRLKGLGQQSRNVPSLIEKSDVPDEVTGIRQVVIVGMGGSGAGGDLVADLAIAEEFQIPVTTWRDYHLPAWIDREVLLIVCSYSGETEETLSAFQAGFEKKARLIAVTSGGSLLTMAMSDNVPVVRIPRNLEPRSAIGYMTLVPLALLSKLGLCPTYNLDLLEVAGLLESLAKTYCETTPLDRNPAKALASELRGHLPIIVGGGLLSGAVKKWKNDIQENAKTWAGFELLPEHGHNGIVAYGLPECLLNNARVMFLDSTFLSPQIRIGYEAVSELLDRSGIKFSIVEAPGKDRLSHIIGTVYLGSWVSYYLAVSYGIDPSPAPSIDFLKQRQSNSNSIAF